MRMRFCLLLAILAFASVGAFSAASLLAQNNGRALTEQQRALVAAREQADQARQRGDALSKQADIATNDADRLASQAAALAARIQASEADIRAARTRIAIVAQLQRDQRVRLAEKQGPMVRLTAALQMMTRKPTALALVEPRSLDELIYVRSIMSTIIPEIERRTASLRDEVKQGEALRVQADRAAASLDESRQRLAERRTQLGSLSASGRVQAARFANDAGLEQERALALGEEARDILDLMDQIREGGEVRESLAALQGPQLRPGQGEEGSIDEGARRADIANAYRLPVIGEITAGLGEISDSGYRARGLTLAVAPGAQIIAPAAGRVVYAGRYRGYGNILIIEHDAGWTSLITNMALTSVKVGDQLVQGAPVGRSGNDDPEVTVELRRNGRPIDIAALIG
jgi:septal ring factor EnvC (AmiA/AmiB activator)